MNIRLLVFAAALLLLPPIGFLLGGHEWAELATEETQDNLAATALTLLLLLCYTLLAGVLVKLRTGNNPLKSQRDYFLTLAVSSSMLVWLLVYLNFFAASWTSMQKNSIWQFALDTLLFALPIPAVLVTRAFLGSFRNLLKAFAHRLTLPAPRGETAALAFAALAAFGLLGGAALPVQLSWLLWISPLFLLLALQLLWHESTIFDVLREGDWGRLVCAALSGLIVGNIAVPVYQAIGGKVENDLLLAQPGYLLFGLLSLQLGDVVAEQWRGKTRAQVFKKKPFPIPVVKK